MINKSFFGLLVGVFAAACGGDSPRSTLTLTAPSAAPTVTTLVVSGNLSLVATGQTSQLTATAHLSSGAAQDVTAQASWESGDTAVVAVSASGLATARGLGVTDIRARYQAVSGTISVSVTPSSNGASIRGRLLDFHTQTGVSGAVIQFAGESQSGDTRATTDELGFYVMSVPVVGAFTISADSAFIGRGRVTGFAYRSDLIIDSSTCISRYGTLADARTLNPVVGATVSVGGGTTTSGPDGWYRVDLGCPSTGTIGFNTTFLYVTHPNYAPNSWVVGRGVQGVLRLDLDLEPR